MMDVSQQTGMTLPIALFIMLTLASIASYMLTLSNYQQYAMALSIDKSRTYFDALTTRQWLSYYIKTYRQCPDKPSLQALPPLTHIVCNKIAPHTFILQVTVSKGLAQQGSFVQTTLPAFRLPVQKEQPLTR